MNYRIRNTLIVLAALTLFTLFTGSVQAQGYEFTNIVDSNDGFDPFEFGCPAINNQGAVAFRGTQVSEGTGIFLSQNGTLIPIIKKPARFNFVGRNPSLNDQGEVSFAATLSKKGGEAIFLGQGGSLKTIAETEKGPFNFFGFDTSLNNNGEVAFKAELDNFDEGLFTGSDGAIATHYLASSSPFGGDDSGPSINDAGEVAFAEFLDTGGSGIFLSSGGNFITIVDDSGPISFAENPSLNAQGVVAFQAFLDNGEAGVFVGNGGPLTTIADTTGPFSSFGFSGPSLNDNGLVAFVADLDAGGQGIFVGPDPVADRVIQTGDVLDGSTVINLVLCSEGLNNSGQLAFLAQLADDRTGVFLATPLP
jgi:hypothetical protein